MIKDLITNNEYQGEKCQICGSEEVYVIHTPNPKDENNIDIDIVFCRCEKCRYIPLGNNLWNKKFMNVYDAVNYWNKKNAT